MAGPWEKYASQDGPWAKYAPPAKTYAPAAGQEMDVSPVGSFGQNVAAGVGKFASDTATGVTQLLNDSAAALEGALPESVRNLGNRAGAALGMDTAKNVQVRGREAIAETRRLDKPLMGTVGGNVGYVGAGLMMAPFLPFANTLRSAATVGGAIGLSNPALDWEERIANTALGAGAGAAGQAATNALARAVRPNTSPQVQALMNEGVTPTPGQVLGGAWKRAEDGATSIPIVGDSIKAGQRRAAEDVNRAAFNRALKPINEKLPAKTTGRDAVEFAYEKLGNAYNQLLPKMTTQADGQFAQDIAGLQGMVRNGAIDPNAVTAFERILQNDVLGKFQGQASITGQTLKQIESDLGQQIGRLARSTDADQRLISDALQEVQNNLRQLVTRSNPQYAKELKNINTGYANFKRVQRAAAGLGAEEGVFSPAQLQNAVKALDRSKDKARFAEGNALMQDLSENAKTALGGTVPDSGTPYRLLTTAAASGGLGAVLGTPAGAAMLAAPVMYSRAGQNALAALLAQRPAQANQLAQLVRSTAPAIGRGSAALAVQK